ncbi:MAG TPA: hypothetical protein VMZ06_01275 [Candidatus Bathyarchaeia archaeon]|nr:hypothetical protein [Candidatus Bathyarchaeia archaeon]
MNTLPDFRELFQLLENHHVDYMVIDGYAVAFHGYPRFTQDVDIFFDASLANVTRVRQALIDFGFEKQDLPAEAFTARGNVLTFGVAPTRVDMLNEIDGVSYAEAKANIVRGTYGDVQINFIGRDDLIRNKLATRRAQDKVDAEQLITPPE